MTAVASTNLAGYLYSGGDLVVQFKSGELYKYEGVTQEVVDAFKAAPSQGKFLNANIKTQFACVKLTQADFDTWCLFQGKSSATPAAKPVRRKRNLTFEAMLQLYPAMGLMF